MPDTTPSRPAMTMREIRDRLGHARPDDTPTTAPARCPGCGHAHHGADVECEASVEHGPKHRHRCLCLARPYASSACPPPMHCQGGSLGYTDIYYLQRGHTVGGPNGRKITPDVLKLAPWIEGDPLMEAIAAAVWERCATDLAHSLTCDDPRNIAAVAATTARQVLGTTDQQPETAPTDRSAEPLAAGLPLVTGRCPACGTAGLFLGDGGYVTCSLINCPAPDAASTVLERPRADEAQQPETEAHPAQTEWIGEVLEDDGLWMYLGSDPDRSITERRRASVTRRFPGVQTRAVRKTTTYTVAADEQPETEVAK